MGSLPRIFIFCNCCDWRDWHSAMAMAEDGHCLGGHVCSSHDFIRYDLGHDGPHSDDYRKHYPDGYEVEYVEQKDVRGHAGISAAYAKNQAMRAAQEPHDAAR